MNIQPTTVSVKNINGKSRTTSLRNQKPLKILCPKTHNASCHLVSTNYGGGLVQGDQIALQLDLSAQAKVLLGSQANARAYKTEAGKTCLMQQSTNLADLALLVQLNDPLVLQAESNLQQTFAYELQHTSVLFLLDWVEAGRIYTGERFAFKQFQSETRITCQGRPLVVDRFLLEPDKVDCSSPAVFLNHSSFINAYLIGDENSEEIKTIERAIHAQVDKQTAQHTEQQPRLLLSADRINQQVFMLRASAVELSLLWEFVHGFSVCFSSQTLLGFNPYDRKY